MRYYNLIVLFLTAYNLTSCAQNKQVNYFAKTRAFELAKAVSMEDLEKIEKLVKNDTTLLDIANPIDGSNVLSLSLSLEKFNSFEKLLVLGADPNQINPNTKRSIMMEAVQPFGSQIEWRKDLRYLEVLLKFGADANYTIENDFVNEKGYHVLATSPLMEASTLDLELVKLLVRYGADPNKKLGDKQISAFSQAVRRGNIDIINYYIDSLKADVHQPMSVVFKKPGNTKVTYYIQDYVVNRFTKAKLMGNNDEVERLKDSYEGIEEANHNLWLLIMKLERMGVDFKNYEYKL
jgi:ankyrin repeat protein